MMSDKREHLGITAVYSNGRRQYASAWKAHLVALCFEPGASVSQIAMVHGVNANLLWKWVQKHNLAQKELLEHPQPYTSAFIPVHIETTMGGVGSETDQTCRLDLRSDNPAERPAGSESPESTESTESHFSPAKMPAKMPVKMPAKMNVSLPNGVKLTLEYGDVQAVTAIIGALSNVQILR
jgi:transposase